MEHLPLTRVTNIKLSAKLDKKFYLKELRRILSKEKIEATIKNNLLVIRHTYVYVLFSSGHVNITGVRSMMLVQDSIKTLESILHLKNNIISITIDNISAAADVKKPVNLYQLAQKNIQNVTIRFNLEKFPGLFFTTKHGTAIVFSSGKIIVIGVKQVVQAEECIEKLWRALHVHTKM